MTDSGAGPPRALPTEATIDEAKSEFKNPDVERKAVEQQLRHVPAAKAEPSKTASETKGDRKDEFDLEDGERIVRGTGDPIIYFPVDPIENLQIRVVLRKQPVDDGLDKQPKTMKALMLQKKLKDGAAGGAGAAGAAGAGAAGEEKKHSDHDHEEEDDGRSEAKEAKTNEPKPYLRDIVSSRTFSWQEKVHGPRETLKYALPTTRKRTPQEEQYAANFRELLGRRYPDQAPEAASRSWVAAMRGPQLHSRTDADKFVDPFELDKAVTNSASKSLNPLAEMIKLLPTDNPTSKHVKDLKYQSYYVLATVEIPDDPKLMDSARKIELLGHQQVLCQISAYDNGTLQLKPGFSEPQLNRNEFRSNEWYQFTSKSGQVWRYRLENASESTDGDAAKAARELVEKEMATRKRQLDLSKNRTGVEFELSPPVGYFRLNIFGEIVKASGFDADDLYVEYELYFPPDWLWSPRDKHRRQQAFTQVSRAMWNCSPHREQSADRDEQTTGRKDCHFGFPVEFELLGRAGTPIQWPVIYFQVTSVDFWERHRVAGNGYLQLTPEPGLKSFVVSTWKPIGSIRSQLTDFFIGGASTLRDLKLAGVPPNFSGKILNKYGFRTENAGSVHFRINTVVSEHLPPKEETTHADRWKTATKGVFDTMRTKAGHGRQASVSAGHWKSAADKVRGIVRQDD